MSDADWTIRERISAWRRCYGLGASHSDAAVVGMVAMLAFDGDTPGRLAFVAACLLRLGLPAWAERVLTTSALAVDFLDAAARTDSEFAKLFLRIEAIDWTNTAHESLKANEREFSELSLVARALLVERQMDVHQRIERLRLAATRDQTKRAKS